MEKENHSAEKKPMREYTPWDYVKPGINAAIAKLNSENKLQSFIDAANDLSTKAVEAN